MVNQKIITGIMAICSWTVFIIIKYMTETSTKFSFYVSIVLTIIFALSFFYEDIVKYTNKEKQKERNTMSSEEIDERINKIIKKSFNWRLKGTMTERKTSHIDDRIYLDVVKLYRPTILRGKEEEEIIFITNADDSSARTQALPSNCEKEELNNAINSMSRKPHNPESITEKEVNTDTFGRPIEKTKQISYAKDQPKEEETVV